MIALKPLRHFPMVSICNPISYFGPISRFAKFEINRLMRSTVILETRKKYARSHVPCIGLKSWKDIDIFIVYCNKLNISISNYHYIMRLKKYLVIDYGANTSILGYLVSAFQKVWLWKALISFIFLQPEICKRLWQTSPLLCGVYANNVEKININNNKINIHKLLIYT